MKVFLLAIGDRTRASSRLRVWDHADWLRSEGHEVRCEEVVPPGVRGLLLLLHIARRLPGWCLRFLQADAVLLQETVVLAPLVPFRPRRTRVIYDFSDPVDRLDRGWRGRLRGACFRLITRRADHVVVENGLYLADLPATSSQFYGPVDYARYQRHRSERPAGRAPRVGWTGSPGTLGLIRPVFPALVPLLRAGRVTLTLMGLTEVPDELAGVQGVAIVPWSEESEFAIVPGFDLGLFALDDSELSRRRGAGKLFIYMAAGVPFIASDRGIARELMDVSGVGFRVRDDDWPAGLAGALASDEVRRDQARRGLEFARTTFSYERYRQELVRRLAGTRAPA